MDELIKSLRILAEHPLKYNADINQHIISCRNAIQIIDIKDNQYKAALKELEQKEDYPKELLNRVETLQKEITTLKKTIKIEKDIIIEAYKIIQELTKKN